MMHLRAVSSAIHAWWRKTLWYLEQGGTDGCDTPFTQGTERAKKSWVFLDMAAYLRRFDHMVDAIILTSWTAIKDHANPTMWWLSVLQALEENVPVSDAIYIKNKYDT
jgi:hypothetical protein